MVMSALQILKSFVNSFFLLHLMALNGATNINNFISFEKQNETLSVGWMGWFSHMLGLTIKL